MNRSNSGKTIFNGTLLSETVDIQLLKFVTLMPTQHIAELIDIAHVEVLSGQASSF